MKTLHRADLVACGLTLLGLASTGHGSAAALTGTEQTDRLLLSAHCNR